MLYAFSLYCCLAQALELPLTGLLYRSAYSANLLKGTTFLEETGYPSRPLAQIESVDVRTAYRPHSIPPSGAWAPGRMMLMMIQSPFVGVSSSVLVSSATLPPEGTAEQH
jgi:hypothetical protein